MLRKITCTLAGLVLAAAAANPVFAESTSAPEWKERLNKDGITVRTRKVEGYKIHAYRAQADLEFPIQVIYDHLTDLSGFSEWIQHIEHFEPISDEEGRWIFYVIIDPPAGNNRDFVGLMTGGPPGADGTAQLVQIAVEGYRPELKNHIRIKDFHQTWDLVRLSDNLTRATLEVLYDPGGKPPVAILNWLVAQGPYETFITMREILAKKQAGP